MKIRPFQEAGLLSVREAIKQWKRERMSPHPNPLPAGEGILGEAAGAMTAAARPDGGVAVCPVELREIVRRLVAALGPERVYLFGSRARGDATGDSDYDLLVVVADSEQSRVERGQAAYAALRDIPGGRAPVDVSVWTRQEFDRQAPVLASLPATVLREGKLLHVHR